MNWNFLSLANIINKNWIKLKISDFEFLEPSFLLWVLSLYKTWIIEVDCSSLNREIDNYLNRINFYKYLSLNSSNINRFENNNLVEITSINRDTNWSETTEIAKKIIQNMWISFQVENKYVFWAFEWIFRELIDNTIQHSKANFDKWGSFFMLQAYPNRRELHICIVDNWIWIKESFRKSKYWNEDLSELDYIKLAFERWKTSDSNIWAWNWLYWTKEIVKKTNSKLNYLTWNTLFTINGDEEKFFSQKENWWNWVLLDININLDNLSSVDIVDWLKKVWNNSSFVDLELDDREYDELFL